MSDHLFHTGEDCFESRLFVAMERAPRPMNDSNTMFVGILAHTHVHTVVRSVVVAAGVHVKSFCGGTKDTKYFFFHHLSLSNKCKDNNLMFLSKITTEY